MNTTDDNIQDNALNNSTNYGNTVPNQPNEETPQTPRNRDYDTGIDTQRSDHDVTANRIGDDYADRDDDQDFVVVGRFTSSSRYDSNPGDISGRYIDDDEDW